MDLSGDYSYIIIRYDLEACRYVCDNESTDGKYITHPLKFIDKKQLLPTIKSLIDNNIVSKLKIFPENWPSSTSYDENQCILNFGDKNEMILKEIETIFEKRRRATTIIHGSNIELNVIWKSVSLIRKSDVLLHNPSIVASIPEKSKISDEKKIIDYKVVTSLVYTTFFYKGAGEFNEKIAEYLKKGYIPYGKYSIHSIISANQSPYVIFSQAVCLYQ